LDRKKDIVRFQNVGMRYGLGPEVFHDVSFGVKAGTFRFVVGASGAGKSTLLKLMYLAHRPSRGLIHMFGRDTATVARKDMPAMRRRIGVVFQDFRLIDHLSALENVALPLRVAGADEHQLRDHVAELLRWVGLENEIHSLPSRLSGGQQQRVAIARAVIGRPDLLLADEPTGNVDNTIAMRILYLLEELNKIGTTVIIATHNEALISRFKFPQLRIEGGRVLDTGAETTATGSRSPDAATGRAT
jgi:cell division transport system ATP-binding protein